MLDLLSSAAKFCGLLWAIAFGLLGLLKEFRDPQTKKVTRWGRVALIGILTSGGLALAGHVIEYTQKQLSQAQELKRLTSEIHRQKATLSKVESVLRGIERQNQSLDGMSVFISIWIPEEHGLLKDAHNRLQPTYNNLIRMHEKEGFAYTTEHNTHTYADDDGNLSHISFALPDAGFHDIGALRFVIGIYNDDADISTKDKIDRSDTQIEMFFMISDDVDSWLSYYPKKKGYIHKFSNSPNTMFSRISIVGLRDLNNKKLALSLLQLIGINYTDEQKRGLRLERIEFRTAIGKRIAIEGETMKNTSSYYPQISFYGPISQSSK